ncbi:MAG: hypothetical protein ACLSX5_04655 [Lachnospiraceae bacterium]
MANILQVTKPADNNIDNRILDNREGRERVDRQQIQNQVDPSRVVRADGQEKGGAGAAAAGDKYSVIDYESNYGAFIQRLKDAADLPLLLKQLFQMDGMSLLFAGQESVGDLIDQLFASMQVSSREELLQFFQNQQASQVKFSGAFFDSLRAVLSQSTSLGLKEAVMAFLKGYNDYTSGEHLLTQMHSLTEDISRLMLKNFRGEFEQMLESMNWEAKNGDTAANTEVLNSRLIPFLAKYISRTHDYGAVRDAVMFLVLHAVRYENGDGDRLSQLYQWMTGNREMEKYFKDGIPDLQELLENAGAARGKDDFSDAFSSLLLKGAEGKAGLENIQQFYNILNGMLINESVYLPLLHLLVPFQYQGKDVMSEIWADPDADKEQGGSRKIKMFFKFDIRELGRFDMVLSMQDRQMDMQLYIPPVLTDETASIQGNISEILKKNGLDVSRLLVREKKGELRLQDVFPEIQEKERTINVRI